MSTEQYTRDFNRGLHTAGTIFENPFPTSIAEFNGQQFARANRGDGGGLAIAMLAIPVLLAALALAVASIPAAIVLLLICIVLNPASRVAFWEAFVAAAFALAGLVATAGALLGLLVLASGEQSPSSIGFQLTWGLSYIGEWLVKNGNTQFVSTTVPPVSAFVVTIATICLPLIGVVALILRWRLPEDFGGKGRLSRNFLAATLFTVLAPATIAAILLVYPMSYSPGEALGQFSLFSYIFFGLIVVLIGGLLFGWLTKRLLSPLIHRGDDRAYARSISAYWWAVTANIALTLASFYVFRGADEAAAAMVGSLAGIEHTASFLRGLPGLLKICLPGVVVGTVIIGLGSYSPNRFRTLALASALLAPVLLAISFASLTLVLALTLFGI